MTRPTCPNCQRELVAAKIEVASATFTGWLCDCLPQPPTIAADIVRAREWDDQGLIYAIEFEEEGAG